MPRKTSMSAGGSKPDEGSGRRTRGTGTSGSPTTRTPPVAPTLLLPSTLRFRLRRKLIRPHHPASRPPSPNSIANIRSLTRPRTSPAKNRNNYPRPPVVRPLSTPRLIHHSSCALATANTCINRGYALIQIRISIERSEKAHYHHELQESGIAALMSSQDNKTEACRMMSFHLFITSFFSIYKICSP